VAGGHVQRSAMAYEAGRDDSPKRSLMPFKDNLFYRPLSVPCFLHSQDQQWTCPTIPSGSTIRGPEISSHKVPALVLRRPDNNHSSVICSCDDRKLLHVASVELAVAPLGRLPRSGDGIAATTALTCR